MSKGCDNRMKKSLNQKGLSLIEVLATLTLLSIVGGLVFGVLINSMNIFEHQSNNNDVKQEANLINNQLITFYKVHGSFEIVETGDSIEVYAPDVANKKAVREFELNKYKISVTPQKSLLNEVESGIYTTIDIQIKIIEKDNLSNVFELNSTISRMKEDD